MKKSFSILLGTVVLCSSVALHADSTLVFNEVMYHPAANEPTMEWLELRNQLAVDIDISGWAVSGGIQYTFPSNTIVRGRSVIVLALSPSALQSATGLSGVHGPFLGRLSNNGDTLTLHNNSGRVVDELSYGVEGAWPVAADGLGASLARRDRETSGNSADNWVGSEQLNGTPGSDNFPFLNAVPANLPFLATESIWRYEASGTDLGVGWKEAAFNDASWPTGSARFFHGTITTGVSKPITTLFNSGVGANGVTLPPASSDPHYTIVAAAQGPVGGPALVILHHPSWSPNDTASSWIGVVNPGSANVAQGAYNYRTQFDLSNFLPGTAKVIFSAAADDRINSVLLNGTSVGFSVVGFAGFSPDFTLTNGFVSGINTLEFRAFNDSNAANPGGARIRARGTAEQVITNTALAQGPNTFYFRTRFTVPGSSANLAVQLSTIADDGAVYYLNGQEIYRHNMPGGAITFATPASENVGSPSNVVVVLPGTALVDGTNVLAVEVHQAAGGTADMLFDAGIMGVPLPVPALPIVFNEIGSSTNFPFWLELMNRGDDSLELEGFVIRHDGATTAEYVFPAGTEVEGGGFIAVTNPVLGFVPSSGDKLYLIAPSGERILDAVVVKKTARARHPDGDGEYLLAGQTSPGAPNTFEFQTGIVINEIMYHHRLFPPTNGLPPVENPENWVELYNRSTGAVVLTGWSLSGGIEYNFNPGQTMEAGEYLVVAQDVAALQALHPGIDVVGPFSKGLSHRGERIVLRDPTGNPADEVRYFDGGRWPEYPDGGGSSLELRDPNADNSKAEAWAASDESAASTWQTYTYRGVSTNVFGPVRFNDMIIGLLGAGECLIDDVSVVESPTNGPVQFIANGNFEGGITGWRAVGTHGLSRVIVDPTNPGNQVLHLIATGPQEHMHNHVETTFTGARSVVDGRVYDISFRAKWLAGANQLNSRLYFNRLPRVTLLPVPNRNGTPGAQNSRFEPNIGPTFAHFGHTPAIPAPAAPVTVSVEANDADGIASMALFWSVNSGAWMSNSMTLQSGGSYHGTIPGQASGVVQFFVRAVDGLGAVSTFPAASTNSGALYAVADGQADVPLAHNIRIVMSPANTDLMHATTNVMSNRGLPCTVIYDEQRAYYDAAVRLKGSQRGRFNDIRASFHVTFPADDPFRGVHPVMLLDRSGTGDSTANRQQEVLIRHMLLRAGNIPGPQPDLARVIAPRSIHTGPAIFSPRHEDEYLGSAYEQGGDGQLFELELIYYPQMTNQFGYKIPSPDDVLGTDFRDLGSEKETYRYNFIIKNNRDVDDYSTFIKFARGMDLSGAALEEHASRTMDVDQWMRSFAFVSLCGVGDMYTQGNNHNLMVYIRPDNHKILPFPWDMDFSFNRPTSSPLYGDQNLQKVILLTPNFRIFAAHLLEMMDSVYNTAYMNRWIDHYDNFTAQDYSAVSTYINDRSAFVRSQLATQGNNTPFAINGTNYLTASSNLVILTGTAPFRARTVRVNGREYPVSWTSLTAWRLLLPVTGQTNQMTIAGHGVNGEPVPGMATNLTVVYNGTIATPEDFLAINEIMYRPPVSGAEFVEIYNRSPNYTFDLSGYRLNGLDYVFPEGSIIQPRTALALAADMAVFADAYPTASAFDQYNGTLDPTGETLSLFRPALEPDAEILVDRVRYENVAPWPTTPEITGTSVQLIDSAQDNGRVGNWTDGEGWRYFTYTGTLGSTTASLFLSSAGELYIDNFMLVTGVVAEAGVNLAVNGGFEQGLSPWTALGNHASSVTTSNLAKSGNASLHIISTGVGSSSSTVRQVVSGVNTLGTYTMSFWYLPSSNATTLTARFGGAFRPDLDVRYRLASPGLNNMLGPIPPFPAVWLNEVQVANLNGIQDGAGDRDPWVELHNSGTNVVSLAGYYLSDSYSNLTTWAFPANASIDPGEYKVIWVDGEPGEAAGPEWHTSFRLNGPAGSIALSRLLGDAVQLVDYLSYRGAGAALSYGDFPDAQPFSRPVMFSPSPGTTNRARSLALFINEFLAGNTDQLADPADGHYEDWFEIYNPTTNIVDLSDYYLTDSLSNKVKFQIPDGYVVPAGGYLLVWADEEDEQNDTNRLDLHVNFRLAGGGEEIGLYTPELEVVDEVRFTNQTDNVSQGRFPDGTDTFEFMTVTTPRAPNTLGGANNPPVLTFIPDYAILLGQSVSFTATASDPDVPPQTLTFTLDPGAPDGASIHLASGLFSWTPNNGQSGSTNLITVRVTDSGVPGLDDSQTFVVRVSDPPRMVIERSGNDISLSFPTVAGRTYRVEYRDDLATGSWQPLGPDRLANGSSMTVPDTIGALPQRFYQFIELD